MRLIKAAAAWAAVPSRLPSAAPARQEKKVRLNLGGAFPSSTAILGTGQLYFVDKVKKLSAGSIDVRFFEPGALVPASQYFDAIAGGSLDSAWTGPRLLHRQGHRLRAVLHGAVRAGDRRVPGLDALRRRRAADAGARSQVQRRGPAVRHHRARGVGLVPQGDQVGRRPQGPQDALLRPRRQRHAEDRRPDPDPAGRRNLPGAAARHHRRDRVLDAGHGPDARLPPGRQALLLPRLAPDGDLRAPAGLEAEMGRALATRRRRSSRPPATRPCCTSTSRASRCSARR